MSHPDGLPRLFLDRSLGSVKVPGVLREAGLCLITLVEHYGRPRDEEVTDPEWLELAGDNGWVALTKDKRIRLVHENRQALITHGVRCFYIANQSLTGEEMAARYLRSLPRITKACARSGPFMFAVHKDRITEMPIAGP